jgi:hypothetical protein
VTAHNQDSCTSASQVAQQFGPVCIAAVSSLDALHEENLTKDYDFTLGRDRSALVLYRLLNCSWSASVGDSNVSR